MTVVPFLSQTDKDLETILEWCRQAPLTTLELASKIGIDTGRVERAIFYGISKGLLDNAGTIPDAAGHMHALYETPRSKL